MNRKGQNAMTLIVTLVLLLITIAVTASTVSNNTETQSATQDLTYSSANTLETFTLTPVGDELLTSTFTLQDGATNLSTPGDYNVTTDGTLTVDYNSTGTLSAAWSYEPAGKSTGLTATVMGFVAVFLAALALAYITGWM